MTRLSLMAIEEAYAEFVGTQDPKPKKRGFITTRTHTMLDGTLCIFVGHRVNNPLNSSHGSWKGTWGVRKTTRGKVMRVLAGVARPLAVKHVVFVRYSPRTLDPDGLAASLKSVQDQVFAWLAGDNTLTGKGDDTGKSVSIAYEQYKQPEFGVGVMIR